MQDPPLLPRRPRPQRPVDDGVLEAAWLYYHEGRNHTEIAARLGVSRATVVNYLAQARDEGLVEIRLDARAFDRQRLAVALKERYGLKAAIVVPGTEFSLTSVAIGAARYFPDLLDRGDTVGVAWGVTIHTMAEHMVPRAIEELTVVQMVGSMPSPYLFAAEGCSTDVAAKLGAKVVNLYAPAILSSPEAAAMMRAEPLISAHFDVLARMNKTIFAVGSCGPDSHVVTSGIATLADIATYRALGAVGIVCGRFIDAVGRHVEGPLDARMIGLTPNRLRGLSAGLLVSTGAEKVEAMHGAMIGGYATHLVTDAPTAQALMGG